MHPSLMTREWGQIPHDAQWREKRLRKGGVEWKLFYPLYRGEHRPTVFQSAKGNVLAHGASGYVREFASIDAAKADIERKRLAEDTP